MHYSKRMNGIGQLTRGAFRINDLLWNPYFKGLISFSMTTIKPPQNLESFFYHVYFDLLWFDKFFGKKISPLPSKNKVVGTFNQPCKYQIKARQDNKYDIAKTSGLMQAWLFFCFLISWFHPFSTLFSLLFYISSF